MIFAALLLFLIVAVLGFFHKLTALIIAGLVLFALSGIAAVFFHREDGDD